MESNGGKVMDGLVSIVIPVFNRASTIDGPIRSCLAQTYPKIEIILVDDGSSDDLEAAIRPFADAGKVRLVKHAHNQGVSAARNTGVLAAEGDYVAFLDSDDEWLPTKLERQMTEANSRSDDHFICGTLTLVTSGDGSTLARPKYRKTRSVSVGDYLFVDHVQRKLPQVSFHEAPLAGGCFAQTSSYFLSRRLAEQTPFRIVLKQYEDMAFLIDLGDKGVDFHLVEEPLIINHKDDRPGRLGVRDDLVRGQQFLHEIGASLSPAARQGFQAVHLSHLIFGRHPLRTITLVIKAFLNRAITSKTVFGILSRCLFGQKGHRLVRNTLRTWRQALARG